MDIATKFVKHVLMISSKLCPEGWCKYTKAVRKLAIEIKKF